MALSRALQNLGRDLYFENDLDSTASGDLRTVEGLENLKQAIYHRLITNQGSLAHRPDYGIGINRYAGAIGRLATQQELMVALQEQFQNEERISSLEGLAIDQDAKNPGLFTVRLTVRAVGIQQTTVSLGPFGGV